MKSLLALAMITLHGCTLLGSDEPDECASLYLTVSAPQGGAGINTTMSAQQRGDIDDQLAGVAEDVPGFGGYYFERPGMQGHLNIYLLNPDQAVAEAAQERLTVIYDSEQIAQAQVRAVQGQYGYDQLLEWYRKLQGGLGYVPGLVFTDIAEDQNRLSVGVSTKRSQDQVVEALDRLDIPSKAVNVEVTDPIKPLDGC